jgi:phytol kinase
MASTIREGNRSSVAGSGAVSMVCAGTGTARAIAPPSLLEECLDRLPPQEWRRRLLHMAPGVLPVALLAIPHRDPLPLFAQLIILTLIASISVFAVRASSLFVRSGEQTWVVSVVSYAAITLAMLLGFPGQPELGLAVTVIIAFGDGSATLGGLLWRGRCLPWNRRKSWAGLSAFLIFSIPLSTIVYWAEARPGVSISLALACVAPAALAAGLMETLDVTVNDNVRVGIAAAVSIVLTQNLFVGWQ